ncbi:ATP-binding cassette subfamily C protein CydC [Isoptericola jiangsuensis]|uniref:ATP-binding cassette subfamily C protein CydC n=1 Tax=Isoptericola jiangsuensis TaxID=548579 RepID=A0A2A9EY90_9MICO|nr:thiol reductant ABC exporter subunit CydC [Isoptericola jiangsuensis]PFG43713.1 ATP-binding cassette subfamily C protein CydC [Isoptericola jiangsuensis]
MPDRPWSTHDPLRRVLPLLEIRWSRVARAVGLGVLTLTCAIGLAAAAAWLIARASQMPPVLTLSIATVGVRAFGTGRAFFRYLERLASHDVALRGMAALRANLYDRLARGGADVVALRRGDLLARVGGDVDTAGDVVVRALVPGAVAVVTGLAAVALLGVFLPAAALVLLGCLLLTGVLSPWLASRASASVEVRGAAARGEVSARTLELLEDGQQLRVAGRVTDRVDGLRTADDRLAAATADGARVSALGAAIEAGAQTLAVLGCLLVGIPAALAGDLSATELAVVVLTPLAVFEVTSALPGAAVQLRRSREAARRLLDLLPADAAASPARRPAAPDAADPTTAAARDVVTDGTFLGLDDVGAGWPGHPPVVAGVDLTLRPGSVVALAGPSGVGKSTLLLTAAGLLPPTSGRVDGGGLFVAEDGHVFGTTLLENLRVARADVAADEATEALAAVGLDAWLAGLPDGLGTVLGTGATDVSGGERRRLLVARALLAPHRVLLVDEPAEHLDAATADALVDTLAALARETGRAVVVASHRLTPLGTADEVLWLGRADDGPARVLARGPHADLLHAEPDYGWAAAQEDAAALPAR